jgi:hypothetical protein
MAFRTYDDGPCANCTNNVCETCTIAERLETAITAPKAITVVELPSEEELEHIMHEAGYYVPRPYDTDHIEPEEINAASYVSRPTWREKDEYEEMLSWVYESIA